MKNRMFRYLIACLALVAMCFTLSGCKDSNVNDFFNGSMRTQIKSRVSANSDLLDKLVSSGLIDKTERDALVKSMTDQTDKYISDALDSNTESDGKIFNAVVDWCVQPYDESSNISESDFNAKYLSNYMLEKRNSSASKLVDFSSLDNMSIFHTGSKIETIDLITDAAGSNLSKRMNYEVYVLKPDSFSANNTDGIDKLVELIKAYKKDSSNVDKSYFDQYFTDSGETLLDSKNKQYQILQDSTGSPYVDSNNKVIKGLNIKNSTFAESYTNEPGKDMIVYDGPTDSDNEYGKPVMAIRLHELNKEAVDNVISKLGTDPDKYLFIGNKVYLLQYPVYTIASINSDTEDYSNYSCKFQKSNMLVNLASESILKSCESWGGSDGSTVVCNSTDSYLKLCGAKSAEDITESSFVVMGKTPDGDGVNVGANNKNVSTSMIVLRDYLEAYYSPGIVSQDNMVAFGRKIRVMQFSGNKANPIAEYYGFDGKPLDLASTLTDSSDSSSSSNNTDDSSTVSESNKLYLNDLCDFGILVDDNPYVKYIGTEKEKSSIVSEVDLVNQVKDSDSDSSDKLANLKKLCVNSISPCAQFPGDFMGSSDMSSKDTPLFYAMAVNKSMFDTGLFSGWINTSATTDSLNWWNTWLKARGYVYSIDASKLNDYISNNYSFELQKSGLLVLDLETVSKIQKEYSKEDQSNTMKIFRTTSVVIGFALICYSFILVMSWVVDTNVDLGFGLLEKLTFGHWIAVKDASEVPYIDTEDRKYVSFQKVVVNSIIISVVGVVLILINVVNVVIWLLQAFGGIAVKLGQLITGRM